MQYVLIKPDSNEWNAMWQWVAEHPLNAGIDEPTVALNELNGEAWQYMGSYRGKGGAVVSEIRHRSHPIDNERKYLKYLHENEIPESDIAQIIPIK